MTARAEQVSLIVAWSGAAAFVASLATFLYSYVVGFSVEGDPSGWIPPTIIDVLLFTGFAAHHSLFARERIKQVVERIVPRPLERSAYTWVASVLFIGVCLSWQPLPGRLYSLGPPLSWIGVVLQLTGLLVTGLGSRAIDVLDLAGVRPVVRAMRASDDPARPTTSSTTTSHVPLQTSGVYAIVRHPVYFGWVLFVWGAPSMTATRALFAVVSCAYLAAAIPLEERSLLRTFGRDYGAYCRRVRWRMMPGIY